MEIRGGEARRGDGERIEKNRRTEANRLCRINAVIRERERETQRERERERERRTRPALLTDQKVRSARLGIGHRGPSHTIAQLSSDEGAGPAQRPCGQGSNRPRISLEYLEYDFSDFANLSFPNGDTFYLLSRRTRSFIGQLEPEDGTLQPRRDPRAQAAAL